MVVERLCDEVVRTGLDRLRPLRPGARREHDHRQHGRLLTLAEPPADRVAVHLRHHDIEEHEVGIRRLDELESGATVLRRDDVVAAGAENGLE